MSGIGVMTCLQTGMLTTIQDGGRVGYLDIGLPAAGCLDTYSQQLANNLVGNAGDTAVLEITLAGPVLSFSGVAYVAVVGAHFDVYVNEQLVDQQQTIVIRAGDCLRFGRLKQGCRAYLAIAGGFQLDSVRGSCSTYLPAAIGGLHGRALQPRDRLLYSLVDTTMPIRRVPDKLQMTYVQRTMLRVVDGVETGHFSPSSQQLFYQQEYRIAKDSNRMGYRLECGQVLNCSEGQSMLTTGVVPGTIQVPPQGGVIMLLADAQTSGGYPRIAHIIQADMHLAGQLKPGDKVRFFRVTLEQARDVYRAKVNFFKRHNIL